MSKFLLSGDVIAIILYDLSKMIYYIIYESS